MALEATCAPHSSRLLWLKSTAGVTGLPFPDERLFVAGNLFAGPTQLLTACLA